MDTAKISDNVFYIGVNDRTTERFENLWPLPSGVSYNSYLVRGSEKTAIIDGVETGYAGMQIARIRTLLDGKEPDYLVINHMEPDHSGDIRLLRQTFPGIQIVGSRQAIAMVEGFYDIADNTLAVADGDSLQLGGVTLSFNITPMVHWPETMMTYLEEERILFSGDAFGCFGALNGAVIDRDMLADRYFPEMIRYYSNIVGKYGAFVQKALHKLKDIDIRTICPTHGPVWQERLKDTVGLYDRLSRYEPLDNGVTIVYGSMYGNTAVLAEEAASALAAGGVRDIAVHNAAKDSLSDIIADLFTHRGIVLASVTYNDTIFPPMKSVLDAMETRCLKNREAMVIGSNTWTQRAVPIMLATLEKLGLPLAADPVVMKQGPKAETIADVRNAASALARILTK